MDKNELARGIVEQLYKKSLLKKSAYLRALEDCSSLLEEKIILVITKQEVQDALKIKKEFMLLDFQSTEFLESLEKQIFQFIKKDNL